MSKRKLTLAVTKSILFFGIAIFSFFVNPVTARAEGEEETPEEPAEASGVDNALAETGKTLFMDNCASCHKFSQKLTGPKLEGVTKARKPEWLKAWIKNPQKMIDAGDKHAVELWGEFQPTLMTSFEWMSDEELDAVIAYLAVGEDAAAVAGPPTEGGEGSQVAAEDDGSSALVLTVVLVVLVLIVAVLILMTVLLMKELKGRKDLDEDDKEVVNASHNILVVLRHPVFIGGSLVVALLVGAVFFITDVVYGIGVQQGYQPTQPIAFSHAIHAGEHEIDCNYCHTGVRKGKHANIPAASICMNCHVNIKTDSKLIEQIYTAIDYDKETKTFGDDIKPIRWVRIHNLPDHVYFNHSQHVVVGGLECEECHGPIQEMEKVYQYSPLTMGWCIDCHRTKAVNAEGNAYYDKLLEEHSESGSKDDMTVEDIGGTECSRCHY